MTRREFLRNSGMAMGGLGAFGLGGVGCGPDQQPGPGPSVPGDGLSPRRVVMLSDLHWGCEPSLDDWQSDAEFARLIEDEVVGFDGPVDLILLGDTMDLWQCEESGFENRAVDDVSLPSSDELTGAKIDAIHNLEAAGVARIRDRHPGAFQALAGLLAGKDDARILFVVGNHDHSVIVPTVQTAVRDAIGGAADTERVQFVSFHDEPRLALYAEHGHQLGYPDGDSVTFVDPNNRLADHFALHGISPGYHFVRLFWNWAEPRVSSADIIEPAWAAAATRILGDWSDNLDLVDRFARAQLRAQQLGFPLDLGLGGASWATPRQDGPGVAVEDELKSIEAMFADDAYALCGTRLDETYRFVAVGHTHREYDRQLSSGARAFNTGSWCQRFQSDAFGQLEDATRRPYVVVESTETAITARLAAVSSGEAP